MFLLEGRSEAFKASVAAEAEGSEVFGDGVPVGVDEDRWFGKFVEDVANGKYRRWWSSMAGVKSKVAPCFSIALMERRRREGFGRNLP